MHRTSCEREIPDAARWCGGADGGELRVRNEGQWELRSPSFTASVVGYLVVKRGNASLAEAAA